MAAERFRVFNIAETTRSDFEEYCKENFQADELVSFSTTPQTDQKATTTAVISCCVTDTEKLLEQSHKFLEQDLVILPEVYESVSATISKHWMHCFTQKHMKFEEFLSECDPENEREIDITVKNDGQYVLTGTIEVIQKMMESIHKADIKLFGNTEKGSGITAAGNGNTASSNIAANVTHTSQSSHGTDATNSQSDASAVRCDNMNQAIGKQETNRQRRLKAPSDHSQSQTTDKLELKRSVSQEQDHGSQLDRQTEADGVAGWSGGGGVSSGVVGGGVGGAVSAGGGVVGGVVSGSGAVSVGVVGVAGWSGGGGVVGGAVSAGAGRVRQLKKDPATVGTSQFDVGSHATDTSNNDERTCRSLDSSNIVTVSIDVSQGKVDYIEQHLRQELNKIEDRLLTLHMDRDGTKWTLTANSRKAAETAMTQLIELVSLVFVGTVSVPVNMDLNGIHAICATNKYKSVAIYLTNIGSGVCEIYGLKQSEVDRTKYWLEDMFRWNELQQDSRKYNMQSSGGSSGGKTAARDDITSSQQARHSSSQDTQSVTSAQSKMPVTLNRTKSSSNKLEFTTDAGLHVLVYQGDMLHQSTDIIVNSANDQLAHGAGLARAILDAGGPVIDTESRAIIKDRGSLKMGDVVHTSAGKLNYKYILHAVPPSGHQLNTGNKEECTKALKQVFYNSMQLCCQLKCQSVSLPPFGAGIFAVPVDIIMGAAFNALQQFNEYIRYSGHQVTLQEVHFISNDAALAADMIRAFNNRITPRSTGGGSGTGGSSTGRGSTS